MSPKQAFFAQAEKEALELYQARIKQAQDEWQEKIRAKKQERKIDKTARALSVEKPSPKQRFTNWLLGLSKPIKSLYPSELATWSN